MDSEKTTVRATVRALDGAMASVEVEAGGCGRCHEEGGCGGQQLTQMFCRGPKTYLASNDIGAAVGDKVVVAIGAGSVRRTANLAYILPLTAAIVGALAGTQLAGDSGGMFGAAGGLLLAFIYVGLRTRDPAGKFESRPHIISRS